MALPGKRRGYLQLAPSREVTLYGDLPDVIFPAAQAWAVRLEEFGALRVYWLTLSEVVRHLHIHLYPRWSEEESRGLPLFEARESPGQPPWCEESREALSAWSREFDVHLLLPPGFE